MEVCGSCALKHIGVGTPVIRRLLCVVPDIRWGTVSESTPSCYQHRLINTGCSQLVILV